MLETILARKQQEIERLGERALRRAAQSAPEVRPFLPPRAGAGCVRLVAELKRASPSRGLLAPGRDLVELAQVYAANGAAAISVVTDEVFFQGSLATLGAVRASAGPAAALPLLRKDFVVAPVQLYETRAAGADAVLLIAAALPDDARLADLHALARELGLAVLVEIHSAAEVERALRLPGLGLVGINNRDLQTFSVRLETTESLRPRVPEGVQVVSESGIFTRADVARLAKLPVDAILVGEALVTAPDATARVRELAGYPQMNADGGEKLTAEHAESAENGRGCAGPPVLVTDDR
jgi:indole-3-glycerol phosphate synthase